MYSRGEGERTYTFEASGGLLHASLVMQDRETDSYWSITTERAIYGEAEGQRLEKLPGSEKTTFGDWKARHPDTLVLSVEGQEHDPRSPYDRYFASESGFREMRATDDRLADKAPVYVFHRRSGPWAVDQALFADGGAVVKLDGRSFFFYREADDSHDRSTAAFLVGRDHGVGKGAEGWVLSTANGRSVPFDPEARKFHVPVGLMRPLTGFDTFWYIWSLSNPGTGLLTSEGEQEPSPSPGEKTGS